jgi:hypothetical protein
MEGGIVIVIIIGNLGVTVSGIIYFAMADRASTAIQGMSDHFGFFAAGAEIEVIFLIAVEKIGKIMYVGFLFAAAGAKSCQKGQNQKNG